MAPTARHGKPVRTININGRSNGTRIDDGVGMVDAGESGSSNRLGTGPDRRVRSGTRGVSAGGAAIGSRVSQFQTFAIAFHSNKSCLVLQAKPPYTPGVQRTINLSPLVSDRLRTTNRPALLGNKEVKGAIESLRTLVTNRWNPEAGLLNLEVRFGYGKDEKWRGVATDFPV